MLICLYEIYSSFILVSTLASMFFWVLSLHAFLNAKFSFSKSWPQFFLSGSNNLSITEFDCPWCINIIQYLSHTSCQIWSKISFMYYRRNYYAGNWASFTFNGLLSWIEEYKVLFLISAETWYSSSFNAFDNQLFCFGLLPLGSTRDSKHQVRTGVEWSNWG